MRRLRVGSVAGTEGEAEEVVEGGAAGVTAADVTAATASAIAAAAIAAAAAAEAGERVTLDGELAVSQAATIAARGMRSGAEPVAAAGSAAARAASGADVARAAEAEAAVEAAVARAAGAAAAAAGAGAVGEALGVDDPTYDPRNDPLSEQWQPTELRGRDLRRENREKVADGQGGTLVPFSCSA